VTPWVWTKPRAQWRRANNTFGWCRCANVGFCCKLAPRQLPKVASNRFLAIGDQSTSEKSAKKYSFLVATRTLTLWVGTMLSAPGQNKKNTFSLGRCAVVGFCSKMAPLQLPKVASNRFLAFGDKIKRSKNRKKKNLFLVATRTLTLCIRTKLRAPWRNEKNTFSLGRCAAVGFCRKMAPPRLPKVASNNVLAVGDQIKSEKSEKKKICASLLRVL
jgi:hypothetical protein